MSNWLNECVLSPIVRKALCTAIDLQGMAQSLENHP